MDREADTKAGSGTMGIESSKGRGGGGGGEKKHYIKCAQMNFIHLVVYPQLTAWAAPGPYPYVPYALGGGTLYVTPPPTVVAT